MTIENSKRLYDHYVEVGYTEAAEDMLNKHPEIIKITISEISGALCSYFGARIRDVKCIWI